MAAGDQGYPSKICKVGIALQGAKGTAKTAADCTVFPLPADESLEYSLGDEILNWGDGTAYAHEILQRIEAVNGGLTLPLIPGLTTDLATWVATEDAAFQGEWATICVDIAGVIKARYQDVKVGSAELVFVGNDTPRLNVTLAGLRYVDTSADLSAVAAETTVPYKPSEQKFEIKLTGGAYATTKLIQACTITIDRKLESQDDGAAIASQTYAEFLSSQGGLGVTGTFDRRMVDALRWADFLSGQLGALKITLTRAANNEVIELPSIAYTPGGGAHAGPGDRIIKEAGVPFTAVSSGGDYTTAPLTWTPT